jgi:hypothetical protein
MDTSEQAIDTVGGRVDPKGNILGGKNFRVRSLTADRDQETKFLEIGRA